VFTDSVPVGAERLAPEVLGWDAVAASSPGEIREIPPHAVAGLLYTSGTTGRSKAAVLCHNHYVRSAARMAEAYGLGAGDVMNTWPPMLNVTGQTYMVLSSLVAGGAVAVFPGFSRRRFWDQVRATGATVTVGLGTIVPMLLSTPEAPGDADTTLRLAVLGGIPVEHIEPFERRFGTKLREAYGSTEADPVATPDPVHGAPPGSFGRPTPDFEMRIADAFDRPVPDGFMGQILVRPLVPDVMFRGYEDDDGFYYFKGRDKFTIRRRGSNISVVELEEILAAHPDIAECVAVGVPAAVGEEDVKVAVVPRVGAALNRAEVRAFCAGRMARFMVPRYVEVRSSLPYTDLAKVKREEVGGIGPGVWDADDGA
jgi:crotonobetaine/carnitine-CoA ligase